MRRWQSDYALACKVRGRWFKSNPALHSNEDSMNNISITVSGQSGTGKSRIALLISDLLKEQGFTVEVAETDTPETVLRENFVDAIAKIRGSDTMISINEVQLLR